MKGTHGISRRGFVGGAAAALGYYGLTPAALAASPGGLATLANGAASAGRFPAGALLGQERDEYDSFAKLHYNENPYGPSEKMLEAMTMAFKYSMRYGYPDGGITEAIAEHHGVDTDHVLLGAGSGEILEVVGLTYLDHTKKVVGVEPSYSAVYSQASGIEAEALTLPLEPDHRQNIQRMIDATRGNYRDVGFVYLCNPNNPTGVPVAAAEVRELVYGIPEDVPILIDEAYHHFVEDPTYEPSLRYVLEGRPVIIARTFSKIYGMAGMRIGYAIARPDIIERMQPYSTGTINALAKWGAAAGLSDHESEARVRRVTLELRKQTTHDLEGFGYEVIPSQTNFFMVHVRRPVEDVARDFRERKVLVGRPFPPMLEHLRVSIGTEEEMGRFMTAFEDIFVTRAAVGRGG